MKQYRIKNGVTGEVSRRKWSRQDAVKLCWFRTQKTGEIHSIVEVSRKPIFNPIPFFGKIFR